MEDVRETIKKVQVAIRESSLMADVEKCMHNLGYKFTGVNTPNVYKPEFDFNHYFRKIVEVEDNAVAEDIFIDATVTSLVELQHGLFRMKGAKLESALRFSFNDEYKLDFKLISVLEDGVSPQTSISVLEERLLELWTIAYEQHHGKT